MNWVGGARSRLKSKDEKRRQKEFFEKMKYGNKVRLLQRAGPQTKAPPPASLDLLSLEAADLSAKKFRKSDTEKSSRSKVKKVELDGSKGIFPSQHHRHHQHHDLELPMSPCAPSKLQLQEPDREQIPSTSDSFTLNLSATDRAEPSVHWTTCIAKDNSECVQSGCYHSTPVPKAVAPVPQHPLRHQGTCKNYEDIFFSFVPGCKSVGHPKEEEHQMAPYTAADEETLSDIFEYSPLSTIPSQSSLESSATTLSLDPVTQDAVSSPAKTTFLWGGAHSKRQFNKSSSISDVLDLTEDTVVIQPKRDNFPQDPHQMTLTPFIRKLKRDKGADQHSEVLVKEEKPTPHHTDLTCKEDDNFLSPFCQNAAKSTRVKCQDSKFPDTLQPPDKNTSHEKFSRSATTCKVEVKEYRLESEPTKEECSDHEQGRDLMPEEDPISINNSSEKQMPTMSMSKVCEQVLREVLQLDSKLTTTVAQTSVTETVLPSVEDFSNCTKQQKKNEIKQTDSKSKVHLLEATRDCTKNNSPGEQMPDHETQVATDHAPKTSSDVKHHQPQNKEGKNDESKTKFCLNKLNQLTGEYKTERNTQDLQEYHEQGHPDANHQDSEHSSNVDNSNLTDKRSAEPSCQKPDSTSPELTSHPRRTQQKDQATQCLIIGGKLGQNKETQCDKDEVAPPVSSHDQQCSHGGRLKSVQGLRFDAYDECVLS